MTAAVSAVPRSVLITGCNRGIGLELVRQFFKHKTPPSILIATCRNPDKADELQAIASEHSNLHILKLDVDNTDSFDGFAKSVSAIVGDDNGLNLLVNNAGMLPPNRALDVVTPEDMMAAFKTNCIGPLFLTRALRPLLKAAAEGKAKDGEAMSIGRAAAVQMSTAVASIAENSGGNSYAYRCSKSGLNMAMKNLSIDLKGDNIMVMAMHPGWVLTDMGGPNALIDTTTCTTTMIETFYALTEKDHGAFLRYNNTPIQW